MIRYNNSDKTLVVPKSLGNFPDSETIVTSGITAEECQEMIDESLVGYATTAVTQNLQSQIDEISGQTGSQVSVEQIVSAGTKIATISVDGTDTDLYAPASGGGGMTPEQVQQQIDESLVDYPTSAVTQDLDERVTELENASVDYATTADTQALETAISGKSTVDWNQIVTGGTKVAEITVDGTKTDVYAPQGGGVTPQDVQDAIDSALTNYYTKSQADSAFTDPAEAEQIATDAVNAFSQNDFQPFASQVGQDIEDLQTGKQDVLTPGTGIQISGNTISATGGGSIKYSTSIADIDDMEYNPDRRQWYADMYQRYLSGQTIYVHGIANGTSPAQTVEIPLVRISYQTGNTPSGFAVFGGIVDDRYYWYQISAVGNVSGTLVGSNREFRQYGSQMHPVASANSLGEIKVGSGLTIDAQGVLSVSGGTSSDGYVWTTDAEYDAMTTAEKEAWYDAVKADVLSGNCKYGLIQQYDYAVPGDYGNSQVKYRVYIFNELEDGYPSLHFSGAEFSGDSGSYKAWNARITRGGEWELWEKSLDMSKFTEPEEDRRMFTITTGLTAYGYFDCYMFNRCFSEPRQSWDFYSAVGSMPLRIVSPHQDNPDQFDLVCTANILACGETPSGLYQDGYAKRFVFRYFLNGELYEAVMDSVSGGSGDGLHLIHNYSVYGNWVGSQADYNAIGAGNYDSKVIYHIDR